VKIIVNDDKFQFRRDYLYLSLYMDEKLEYIKWLSRYIPGTVFSSCYFPEKNGVIKDHGIRQPSCRIGIA